MEAQSSPPNQFSTCFAEGGVASSPSSLLGSETLRMQRMEIEIRQLRLENHNLRVDNANLSDKVKLYKNDFAKSFRLCAYVLEGQEEFKEKVLERIQKKNRLMSVKKCDCWIDERVFWIEHAGV